MRACREPMIIPTANGSVYLPPITDAEATKLAASLREQLKSRTQVVTALNKLTKVQTYIIIMHFKIIIIIIIKYYAQYFKLVKLVVPGFTFYLHLEFCYL